MSTLWKRATPAQRLMLRAISGAVVNASHAHPESSKKGSVMNEQDDPLTKMADGLRIARDDALPWLCHHLDRAQQAGDALKLAIHVAEIIARNPKGFRNWVRVVAKTEMP